MSNITQADIDRAMEIINTPFGGNRGMAILSKSNYMYLCGMVQAMTKRIAELEHKLANYSAAADGHTHWCPECKMREDRIAELEKEIKWLKNEQ
jgi:predicted RNase H-like nuclease (RuvC/YqgF family)